MTQAPSTGPHAFASPTPAEVLKVVRELTGELTADEDPERVLTAIVGQARLLLGADIVDVGRNDLTAGQIWVCCCDGARTQQFATMRMGLGTGVLGLIASGKTFAATRDYVGDPDLVHDPQVDRIVADEGVKAVAGVPLGVRGRVVGAMLVEHRSDAVLSSRGRAALEQLAGLAAIALGRILDAEESAREKAQTHQANALSAARSRRAEELLALDDALLSGLARAGSTASMVQTLTELLGCPVALYAPGGRLLAGRDVIEAPVGLGHLERLNAVARTSANAGEAATLTSHGERYTVVGLAVGNEHLGCSVVAGADPEIAARLVRGAGFLTAALIGEQILVDADSRPATMLIEQLLRGAGVNRSTRTARRLARHGILDDREVMVLCLLCDEPTDLERGLESMGPVLRESRGIAAHHGDHVCVCLGEAGDSVDRKLAEALQDAGIATVLGRATRIARDVFVDLPQAHQEALRVAEAAHCLGLGPGVHDAADLGIAGMMIHGIDPVWVDQVIERLLGRLLDHDRRHGTELLRTAFQYLEQGRHLGRTAQVLNIHISTVKKRLARIDEVQGPGWRSGPRAVDAHFALRLWQLRNRAIH